MKSVGVNIKVELHVEEWDRKLTELRSTTPKTGPMSDQKYIDDDSYIYDQVPIVQADLLGYDIAYSHLLQGYVPVLERDRLYSSIAYPKKTSDDIKDGVLYKAYRIMRYTTLRIMGAWTKPVINAGIRQVGDSVRSSFEQSGYNPTLTKGRVSNSDEYTAAVMEELGVDEIQVQQFKFTQNFMLDLNTPKHNITNETSKVSKVDMNVHEYIEMAKQNKRMLSTPSNVTPYRKLKSYLPLATIMSRSSAKVIDAFNAAKNETDMSPTAAQKRLKVLTSVNEELTRQLEYAIEVLTQTIPNVIETPTMISLRDPIIANPMISKLIRPKDNPVRFISGVVTRSQKKNAKKKMAAQKRDMELSQLREASMTGLAPTRELPPNRDLIDLQDTSLLMMAEMKGTEWRQNK